MKTLKLKAALVIVITLFSSLTARAAEGLLEKFKDYASNEFSNMQGLYIMAGIIVASLVIYVLLNHFGKEEERRAPAHYTHSRRHHHHHRVIKKTS